MNSSMWIWAQMASSQPAFRTMAGNCASRGISEPKNTLLFEATRLERLPEMALP
jgi:hypothetical protein